MWCACLQPLEGITVDESLTRCADVPPYYSPPLLFLRACQLRRLRDELASTVLPPLCPRCQMCFLSPLACSSRAVACIWRRTRPGHVCILTQQLCAPRSHLARAQGVCGRGRRRARPGHAAVCLPGRAAVLLPDRHVRVQGAARDAPTARPGLDSQRRRVRRKFKHSYFLRPSSCPNLCTSSIVAQAGRVL